MSIEANTHQTVQHHIAAYDPLLAQVAELEEHNRTLVFEYEDRKGNKEARSHVFKLRQLNGALDRARKEAKADALEYGRQVDRMAKTIGERIAAMIEIHQKPLDEIEQREERRQKAILAFRDSVKGLRDHAQGATADGIELIIGQLHALTLPSEANEDELSDLVHEHSAVIKEMNDRLAAARQYEADQRELARLRAEEEARRQAELKRIEAERIAAEARALAEHEAAEKVRLASLQAEHARMQAERAEREREQAVLAAQQAEADAAARAEQAVADERARMDREQAEKAAAERAEAERRQADIAHKTRINTEALADFMAAGYGDELAKKIITLIARGQIRNITINY